MTDFNVKELVDGLQKDLHDLKGELSKSVDKRTSATEAKLDEMSGSITSAMQKLQEKEQSEKALEAKIASLEAALSRPGATGGDEGKQAEYKNGLNHLLRTGEMTPEFKQMSSDINPEGGYLVSEAMSDFIVSRVFETSPMRLVARQETINTNAVEFLIDDEEHAANWVGERQSRTATDEANLGKLTINIHELNAQNKLTNNLIADARIDLESWNQGKVADKFARAENTAFISGDGVLKPMGVISYAAWGSAGVYERNKIEQINSGSNSAITADQLIAMQNALKEDYQANAVWMMKRGTFGDIMKLKGTSFYHFLGMQPDDRNNFVQNMTLLGKRVVFADDFQANGIQNNLAAAYGDFGRGYTIVDRSGIRVIRDPYTAKPYLVLDYTKRVGGAVTNFDAIKLLKISA
jgi:HK97 family phage major capsid protein